MTDWDTAMERAAALRNAVVWQSNEANTVIAKALLDAEQRGRQGMLPLVEQAYRDGVTYATICDVEDKDMAWEQSSIRAKALEKVGG